MHLGSVAALGAPRAPPGMKDPYEVLAVSRDASPDDIKHAYRRLAHRFHPDKNAGSTAAEERFKEATRAYGVLSDPVKRRDYDLHSHDEAQGSHGAGERSRGDAGDMFSQVFGDVARRRGGGGRTRRGSDRLLRLQVDFATAIAGGERTVEVPRWQRCRRCIGTGAKPGTAPQICHACGGTGEIRIEWGLAAVAKKCSYCKARGKIISEPCRTCGGSGFIEVGAPLRVCIPRGVENGTVLRFPGGGGLGQGMGPPGDLRITLEVASHPVFRRAGLDIHVELPVTIVDAALGAQVEVPTLDGCVRMTVPPGTQSGRVFRLRGKGIADAAGARGDQHVAVLVETPQDVGERERRVLDALRVLDTPEHYPQRRALWRQIGQRGGIGGGRS